ncbi:hypothetical protein D3C78_1670500 [compost metagenome]
MVGELRAVFVDHRDGRVVQGFRQAGGGAVDPQAEGPEDQQQHGAVAPQAVEFLEPQVKDIGQDAHHASCFFSASTLLSVSNGMAASNGRK